MASRLQLAVDTGVIARNMAHIRRRAGNCAVLAVIKADAYGLGALRMGEFLKTQGVTAFGAATIDEALALVPLGLPVQILGALLPEEIAPAVAAGLRCPVDSYATAERLSREAVKQQKTVDCEIAVDTGMGRLGLVAGDDAIAEIRRIAGLPNLELNGIYAHFSSAGEPEGEYTALQLKRFLELFRKLDMPFKRVHHAATEGIELVDAAAQPPFTQVRAGLGMYRDALTLTARLGAVRRLKKGSFLGYSRTCQLERDATIGVVCAGYADGIPLALSNRGEMLVRGHRCPVRGRVSMDYTLIDLSAVPDAAYGDPVECFGHGPESVRSEDWGVLKDTHLHDILCAVSPRVERIFRP